LFATKAAPNHFADVDMASPARSTSPERRGMRRTKSSLLAFRLREFLDSKDQLPAHEPSMPPIHESTRSASHRPPSVTISPQKPTHTDAVWVDCFYYGFYLEKSKLPAFQASLKQQKAMQAVAATR